jgi:hypothetical protein
MRRTGFGRRRQIRGRHNSHSSDSHDRLQIQDSWLGREIGSDQCINLGLGRCDDLLQDDLISGKRTASNESGSQGLATARWAENRSQLLGFNGATRLAFVYINLTG